MLSGRQTRTIIRKYAENGKVGVVENGRDCDGVKYWGRVHIIAATLTAFRKLDDEMGQWADGPYHFSLCRVSELDRVEYGTRDLVMEAHEDGHRHVIYG